MKILNSINLIIVFFTTLEVLADPEHGATYGYGVNIVTTKDGVRSFGHAGGFEGAKAMLGIYPDSGFTYVMLSNLSEKADNVPPELSSFIEKLFNERFRAK